MNTNVRLLLEFCYSFALFGGAHGKLVILCDAGGTNSCRHKIFGALLNQKLQKRYGEK